MLDRPILAENENSNQPKITQKRDKDSLGPAPKHSSTLLGAINTRREKRWLFTLPKMSSMLFPPFPLPKMSSMLLSFPPFPRELNKLCCMCLLRHVTEKGELEGGLNTCKHGRRGSLELVGSWLKGRNREGRRRRRRRRKIKWRREEYCQPLS